MKKVIMLCTLIIVSGCTTISVNKIDSVEHKPDHVCIEENPKVWVKDFLMVLESGFMRHGISTEIFKDKPPAHCEYILTYIAGRSWDFAPFLNHAEIRLTRNSKTIASALYHHSGGFGLNKWESTETKMAPVIDELLSDFKPKTGQTP